MKRTVIKYVNLPDNKVRITGIENVASSGEIGKEFGNHIKEKYTSKRPWYGNIGPTSISVFPVGKLSFDLIVGQEIDKQVLKTIIQTMKAAGNRLQDIKKQAAESEEKTIII